MPIVYFNGEPLDSKEVFPAELPIKPEETIERSPERDARIAELEGAFRVMIAANSEEQTDES